MPGSRSWNGRHDHVGRRDNLMDGACGHDADNTNRQISDGARRAPAAVRQRAMMYSGGAGGKQSRVSLNTAAGTTRDTSPANAAMIRSATSCTCEKRTSPFQRAGDDGFIRLDERDQLKRRVTSYAHRVHRPLELTRSYAEQHVQIRHVHAFGPAIRIHLRRPANSIDRTDGYLSTVVCSSVTSSNRLEGGDKEDSFGTATKRSTPSGGGWSVCCGVLGAGRGARVRCTGCPLSVWTWR